MPYPLTKLQYGLCHRLSDISTPYERYMLQTAAGDASICPPTLQPVDNSILRMSLYVEKGDMHVECFRSDNDLIDKSQLVLREDCLQLYDGSLYILGATTTDRLKPELFTYCLLRPYELEFRNCYISKQFLDFLSGLTAGSVTKIQIVANIKDTLFNFTDILTAFPSVNFVQALDGVPKDWAEQILAVKDTSFSKLNMVVDKLPIESLEATRVINFLKTQKRGFQLSMQVWDNFDITRNAISTLKKCLSQSNEFKYYEEDFERPELSTHIIIIVDSSMETWVLL